MVRNIFKLHMYIKIFYYNIEHKQSGRFLHEN